MSVITEFRVARDDLTRTGIATRDVDLIAGEILCRVDDMLLRSVVVGDTHVGTADGEGTVAGPRPGFFFAPTHLATRMRDTAPGGFLDRFASAWAGFLTATAPWLRFVEGDGADAVAQRFAAFVAGRVDPAEGVILRL